MVPELIRRLRNIHCQGRVVKKKEQVDRLGGRGKFWFQDETAKAKQSIIMKSLNKFCFLPSVLAHLFRLHLGGKRNQNQTLYMWKFVLEATTSTNFLCIMGASEEL
ncbi:hypothetical protein MLD38_009803 [Melastoma candidum]|uniref:Uncharacterized protein n=1 Tax=Melastoma candidum TaxID=119954 RepID=A0ACB9RXU7_9MYRT|nr:hypothetical protein MLD38_009803 [Melastoma candidum]